MPARDSWADVALLRCFPHLARTVPWVRLGQWPTPVEPMESLARELGGAPIYVKREDLSSPGYGGNKVRTLEALLGQAVAAGADRIWGTGAFGSNHVVATAAHAAAAGLATGAILFPQPPSRPARDNVSALLSLRPRLVTLRSVVQLPVAMARVRRDGARAGERAYVMAPGGAIPEGTFGALSAGLELARQVEAGECPAPERIVVAVGSTCTTAGLLVGLALAARLGIGFGGGPPLVEAVRVTPWPITSPLRIVALARRSARLLEQHVGPVARIGAAALRAGLDLQTAWFGGGYGRITAAGYRAMETFARHGGPPLDAVYSAKSAAALLRRAPAARGPLLFWATKSSAPLPRASDADMAAAPPALARFLEVPGAAPGAVPYSDSAAAS